MLKKKTNLLNLITLNFDRLDKKAPPSSIQPPSPCMECSALQNSQYMAPSPLA